MNTLAKSKFAWLLKREYWESHRGFLWAQIWAAAAILIITILAIIAGEVARFRDQIQLGPSGGLGESLQNALDHNMPALVRGLDGVVATFGGLAALVLFFVVFFYLLGALYDDRRDRSILFWKSLPISDTATVLSKVVAGIVVAPIIAVLVVLAGYICAEVIASIWFFAHGLNAFSLVWAHADPYSTWLHLAATIPVNAVWALPTVGWLLLWSAMVRSKPFLWAVAIPIIAGVLNSWIALLGLPHVSVEFFWNDLVGRALLSVVPASWVTVLHLPVAEISNAVGIDRIVGTYGTMYHTFLTPDMWIGAAVGIVLIAAAIWFRRWRDET
ncbi:MAG TPA: hypothetical protein VF292_04040 [Rhodanobacteraceae bacterium]